MCRAICSQVRYVGCVAQIEILTPRGVTLSATFTNPVDTDDAAVIFSHPFLCDRNSSPHFPVLAAKYRSLGYATLIFDYSGHGRSGDDPITLDRRVEDLRAASGWLADQGFTRQLLHAHSSGTTSALKARPKAVRAMFLSSPVTGPLNYDWEAIFSPTQLEELEKHHRTRVPDDTTAAREYFEVIPQTLIDLSLNRREDLLSGLEVPAFFVYDKSDVELGLTDAAVEIFASLPAGSRVEIVEDVSFGPKEHLDQLWDLAEKWVKVQLPLPRKLR